MTDYDTADLGVFLSDFAVTATATTWGTSPEGIFDREYVETNDISGVRPTFTLRTSDVPATAARGDLFTITVDGTATNYQLVDKQYADPGMTRIILALV